MKNQIINALCALGLGLAGSALAAEPAKGIVDLTTNYGASGAISRVVGVSGVGGAADKVEVTFARPMHPGNFGMGVNFAKAWTKTWNAENTVLTVGGDIDFSDAVDPALIVYLMQTEADRKDVSEPNIFKFKDIELKSVAVRNGKVEVEFDNSAANGKGYGVYVAKTQDTKYKAYGDVTWHANGVSIQGLGKGLTYWFYVEYLYYERNGLVSTRTAPIAVTISDQAG